MPQAMGVMPLIEPPDGRGGRWSHLLMEGTLEAFDGRRADLQLVLILQIPAEPFSPEIRFGFDRLAETLLGVCGHARGLRPWGRPFWDPRQGQALPYPLNGPGTGSLRAAAVLDLRRTPGGMALAEGDDSLFGVEGKSIVGPLRAAWLVLQGLGEGGEGPTAEFVEITPTDSVLGGDLWERDPTEEVQDGRDPLGNLRGQERLDGRHRGFVLAVDHAR
jgi:hypothetical protein